MTVDYPVIPGAEAWAAEGDGMAGKTGIAVVHGFTGNPTSTIALGQALGRRGYRVEVLRLPGHGTSWRDLATTNYSDWRAEVVRGCERLAGVCDRVVLVGISAGGTLALDVACDGGRKLAGVVAINAQVLDREGLVAKLAPLVVRLLPVIPAAAAGLASNDTAKPGVDERSYAWIPTRAARSVLLALPLLRKRLPLLRLPLLLMRSTHDHSVPPKNSDAIAAAVAGPVTRVSLTRSYHMATMDYDAELIEEQIAAFVEQLACRQMATEAAAEGDGAEQPLRVAEPEVAHEG